MTAAVAPGAPSAKFGAVDNIACKTRHGNARDAAAAFERAAQVVTLDLVNQRVPSSPMEPRSTLAMWDVNTVASHCV